MRLSVLVCLVLLSCKTPYPPRVVPDPIREAPKSKAPDFEIGRPRVSEEGFPFAVYADPGARYWMISNQHTSPRLRLVTTKRIGKYGESFSIRLIDCQSQTFAYVGDADTLEEAQAEALLALLDAEKLGPRLGKLSPHSTSSIVAEIACELSDF